MKEYKKIDNVPNKNEIATTEKQKQLTNKRRINY